MEQNEQQEASSSADTISQYILDRTLRISISDTNRRFLQSASEIYDTLSFETNRLYNEKAPEPWISFLIGGILTLFAAILYVLRLRRLRRALQDHWHSHWHSHYNNDDDDNNNADRSLRTRAMISAFVDNDDPGFTVLKFSAQSLFFLGGVQLNYQRAFVVMLVAFGCESSFDSMRVLLAFGSAESLADYTATSKNIKRKTRNRTQLSPTNVYEDLTRQKTIVFMVFVTQAVLIAFVCVDIYENSTHTCLDGTQGCPVAGTLGSWCFYLLGIFMACVYLLGPKTAYGQSEQNPGYWLKLFLMAKQSGARVSWHDPVSEQVVHRRLRKSDWRIWARFIMSFLVNGVGFHILVHALPLQVAAQSSLTGVVFRAVGMMYLVDLDDTPGYTMTLVEEKVETETNAATTTSVGGGGSNEMSGQESSGNIELDDGDEDDDQVSDHHDEVDQDTAVLAQKIIDDAKAQLDALGKTKGAAGGRQASTLGLGAASLAAAGGITATGAALMMANAGPVKQSPDIPPTLEDGDGASQFIPSERQGNADNDGE